MTSLPIADYALLSDRHSAVLVNREGSMEWLCFPRFDSTSVFASLLDKEGGHWSIKPAERFTTERMYMAHSMVLQTSFLVESGSAILTDAMELGDNTDEHLLGKGATHTVLRSIECTQGAIRIQFVCKPRLEYGLITPVLTELEGGFLAAGGSGQLVLSAPIGMSQGEGEISADLDLRAGDCLYFALQYSTLGSPVPAPYNEKRIKEGIQRTQQRWQEWSAIHQTYDGPWRDLVLHSGRVLQALSYQPTGAIVAAATTSLPEEVGGQRNWDYRYSWLRDASFTMQALWIAACPDEAEEFFRFVTAAAAHSGPQYPLQIMFGVGGEHDLSERELPQLQGWRESSPVRVGNGAWNQVQLDVYGELMDAAFLFRDHLGDIQPGIRLFLTNLAHCAVAQWRERDNGIWEIRGAPQHFLYSKLMCWVALDRGIKLSGLLDATQHVPQWREEAQAIRAAILEEGWNDEAKAFTQHFGSKDLDASALMLPIVGFLPATDPRILSTVTRIEQDLTDSRGLVYRYQTKTGVDGIPGEEGSFLLCTFWLAQVLAMSGRPAEARDVLSRTLPFTNDVGLLAEEIDSSTGEQLGNFPQAFSHIGLINAAQAIQEAEKDLGSSIGD